MGKTGIEVPKIPTTGIDTEQVKAHLNYHSEVNKTSAAVKEKLFDHLLSANFFVFLIIVLIVLSGILFMNRENSKFDEIITFWQLIIPVVTTYIGYAIGKGKGKDS